jgi:MFS family permease
MITYRSVELGADSALVGAVGATFALAPLLFAIPIGRWVDQGRAGFALFAGAGISLLTAGALLFINSIPLLMLAMPMLGIGHLLTMVGGQTMIANRSQDAKLEKNFGLLTFYASLGQAIGPFTGGVLADTGTIKVDTNAAIGFAAVLFAFAVITTIPLVRGSKAEAAMVAGNTRGSVREVLGLPNFKSAIFVASAITAVIDVVLIFMPLLGRELGLTTTEVGVLLAVRSLSSMGVRLALGQLTKRFGMKWTLNGGSIVTLLSCVAIAVFTDFWVLLIIMAISGFAMGIGQPATMAWVTRISSSEHRGLAISIRLTANRLGQVAVPTVAGVVAGGGVGAVFFMLAALQAGSIVATARALGDSD